MNLFQKLVYFFYTGRSGPQTGDDLGRARDPAPPRTSGIAVLFITFCTLAIVAKIVLEVVTGDSFDLSVGGLVSGFTILMFAAVVLVLFLVLRKLFVWRYGESEASGEYPGRSGCGVIVLIIVGAVGLLTLYIRHSYEVSQKAIVAPLVTAEPEPASESRLDPTDVVEAERRMLMAKLDALYTEAHTRWRADVDAAGATGALGEIPPMLEVTARGTDVWVVKNHARGPACVRLVRVTELPDKRLQRCHLDTGSACEEVSRDVSRTFSLTPGDGSPGCSKAKLEFRVGTLMTPEPSWWSTTALKDLDESDNRPSINHANWSTGRLRGEITLLENMPADPNRAARWRRELAK